ncbi:MAG: isoleucine--tRNA ligase [Proteobacteria bacterium SG_bin6]|nr:MAG: isoleucine--tRNA ligase [Proteobacteria bacterium SG_bin6]
MSDAPEPQRDWRDTVFLPKTDFPMKAGLPAKEPGILARWQQAGLYEQLRAARAGREKFILHDGPPYANGDMHIGHALNHILKDMVCRTRNLMGYDAPYVPGWDCHGLPIEWKVEEEYRKQKKNKDEVPPAEFRAQCRAYAQKWVDTQREQLKRLGILGDWDHPYLTMDFQAEATIVSELMKFAMDDQLYRGAKPVMWSPVEKTALAEAEVEYEDIVSTQIDVAFEIVECPNAPELVGAHAVVWTTTPWTIPVNQALAYGSEVWYEHFELKSGEIDNRPDLEWLRDKRLVVARDLLPAFLKRLNVTLPDNADWSLGATQGGNFEGATARHPMAKFFSPLPFRGGDGGGGDVTSAAPGSDSPRPNPSPEGEGLNIDRNSPLAEFFLRPRPFLPGDFVTTDQGTGLVHMAPDHGEDDFALCKAHGLNPVFAVEGDGKYRADWPWLGGQGPVVPYDPKKPDRLNAPPNSDGTGGPVCEDLKRAGALLSAQPYPHSYPHSWRSKAKLIFRCTPQWFVPMDRSLSEKPSPLQGSSGSVVPPAQPQHRGAMLTRNWLGEGEAGRGASASPLTPTLSPEGEREQDTLRARALAAIDATQFYPPKGRNRIRAMVEGRPDWVLSRQRAWGVPITLFVHRQSGAYLKDAEVNARIVAAIRESGVDAWTAERAQEFLGDAYRAEDYEQVFDILDVWFDSGCTHGYVLDSGRWPDLRWPADLYLEGSDQHRGWFQSSLLEACGTRGRAPYDAVLTHGFTMDAKGMKMSKSLGNTINPLDLMRDYGADILRLWALSVDFTEDHRIGKEILAGVADQYRKLRNSFRYLLGALEGFDESERVAVAEMPELERYMLSLLARLDGELRAAAETYEFNRYVRLLTDFANEDLSAFYFDIRKDALYCDVGPNAPGGTLKRRAYRTVLDTLFHALLRYAAPVIVFTAEEVWTTRYPEAGSVHLLEWPDVSLPRHPGESRGPASSSGGAASGTPDQVRGDELMEKWEWIRGIRSLANRTIEPLRRDKSIGSSLEADVNIALPDGFLYGVSDAEMAEYLIVASAHSSGGEPGDVRASATRTPHHKCGRCWRHLPEVAEDNGLCGRCAEMVA